MLGQKGIKTTEYVNVDQILIAPELAFSMGCVVDDALGVAVGSRKIVRAGTPLKGTPGTTTPMVAATDTDVCGILLHDVDVTDGDNNGTVLLFGFINKNRIDATTAAKFTATMQKNLPLVKMVAVN